MEIKLKNSDSKKNGIKHVKDHLIGQLEMLGDIDLKGQVLAQEIDRAAAMAGLGDAICKLSLIEIKTAEVGAQGLGPIDRLNLPKIDNI